MGVLITRLLAGGGAAFLAWALMEPSAPRDLTSGDWAAWENGFILLLGLLVGGAVGALEGWSRGGRVHLLRGLALGAFFGGVGAVAGRGAGGAIAFGLFGPMAFSGPLVWVARTMAFTAMGALIGLAIGASQLSVPRARQGLIGGLLGGAAGGALFDPIGLVLGSVQLAAQGAARGEVGGPSRAVAFTIIGAMIGLMIGLVALLSRKAWLRLELGRNEGREWPLEKVRTNVGRDERADVPLFGDPAVLPLHVAIDRQGRHYVLHDGSGGATLVDGRPMPGPVELRHGMRVQMGSTVLAFSEKGGRSVGPAPAPIQMPTAAPAPTPFLVATNGPLNGQRIPIQGSVEVGREAAVSLAGDARASRRHARFHVGPGGVEVEDLGSTNGVLVNGARVPRATLSRGDLVTIGSTTFRMD